MAVDQALMEHARLTGHTVLRVYEWSRPVLSLGVNQRARGVYDLAAVERRGIEVVRGPTGGRALLHHREVTYAVAAPVTTGEGLVAMYRRVNDLLVTALSLLGVRVSNAAPSQRAATPSPRPCFAEPAKGELVVDGRKLVGSAQWRDAGTALQHGSMLVEDDQSLIPSLMHEPQRRYPPPPRFATSSAAHRRPQRALTRSSRRCERRATRTRLSKASRTPGPARKRSLR